MPTLDTGSLDITVVLGTTAMPVHHVLRLGRGAIIELDASEDDEVQILANNLSVAKGTVVVQGNRIAVEVRELLPRAIIQYALAQRKQARRKAAPSQAISMLGGRFERQPNPLPATADLLQRPRLERRSISAGEHPKRGHGGIGRRTSLRC